jgi:polygalacturonase
MKKILFALSCLLCWGCVTGKFTANKAGKMAATAWKQAKGDQLPRVKAPAFPQRDFKVTLNRKPVAGWHTECRSAVQRSIDSCFQAGGGRVVVPTGNYRCDGPLHLRSNVNLHLQKGAVIHFDTAAALYLPLVKVRWEGTVCWNYSPLIYAFQQKNIALTGEGTLNGQSLSSWKNWRARQDTAKKRLRQMGSERSPEAERRFGEGYWLRPSLVEFFECENVLVEGLTLKESPFWTLHPVFCKNVTLRHLTITGGFLNDDGIDPDSCEDVLIEHCDIHTEDDAISVKAGRDQDAWNRPGTRRVWVRHCTLRSEQANAFCIGSELSGGVEQVYVEQCKVTRARYGINFKTNNDRGGYVRQIFVRNMELDTCWESLLFFQTNYHSYRGGNFPTQFSDFFIQQVHCQQVDAAPIRMNGLPNAPIQRVYLEAVQVDRSSKPNIMEHAEVIRQ